MYYMSKFIKKSLKELTSAPTSLHSKHVLMLNSGFHNLADFTTQMPQSETIAQQILIKEKIINKKGSLIKTDLSFFFQINKQIAKKIPTPDAPHGGGTILEYVILAKILGNKIVNLIVHGTRLKLKCYNENEIKLPHPRGAQVIKFMSKIKEIIKEYQIRYNIKINLNVEEENLGNFDQVTVDNIKLSHKKITQLQNKEREMFDNTIFSTHLIPFFKQNKLGFIDGSKEELKSLLCSYQQQNMNQKEAAYQMVMAYIKFQQEHVEKKAIKHTKNSVLGHPALITNLVRYEIVSPQTMQNIFIDKHIKKAYFCLFKTIVTKKMLIGINIRGGSEICELLILPYIQEFNFEKLNTSQELRVTLDEDCHGLFCDALITKNWPHFKNILIQSGITHLWELN